MEELKLRNLFFIDSLTSPKSVAYHLAKAHDIPTARNQVFLDNNRHPDAIKAQIWLLARIAVRHGVAVGIGHAHSTMARSIRETLPMLKSLGIELVFASQIVQ